MDLYVQKMPGQLPETWDRSVVFFANLLSLFYGNEAGTDVLRTEVGALESYGSRLVPLINLLFRGEANVLILERAPEEALLRYFTDDLKLSLPKIKILSHEDYLAIGSSDKDNITRICKELSGSKAKWVDGYVTDDQLAKIAGIINKETISSPEGSRKGNNKLLLHQYLERNGSLIFDTHIAYSAGDIEECLAKLKASGYKWAVIKSSVGASGIGMKKVELDGQLVIVPEYLFYEGPCLVQGWLDSGVEGVSYIGSPSVQMFLTNTSLALHDITEQILSTDSVHEGNVAPPTIFKDYAIQEEILRQAQDAGHWLHAQGYRGTASVDFHLLERDQKTEVRVCEVNARVTGATYPVFLARHFMENGVWLMRNIRFNPAKSGEDLINLLREKELLYLPNQAIGVLPINLNPDKQGGIVKGQFLFLGKTHKEVYNLLERVNQGEHTKGAYDRD